VFVSHASEDKDAFVRPLATALNSFGVSVWYDEFSLRIGDSLSRSIDKGLSRARFGLVVISPAFIAKRWPEYELRGLIAREGKRRKIILPVWHGVEHAQVLAFSPPLADKIAIRTSAASPTNIAIQILRQVRPDLYEKHPRTEFENIANSEAIEELFQAQKLAATGQLAGGIAHDFNNVLSAILMATDFLLNAHKPTDPSFKDIIQIKQNANRAAALVRQLLAFSRKQTLRPQVLDLGETLSDLGMLLKRLIGEKVTLEVVHGRDLWPVKVDLSQFEQVIVNLAVNARDAMPDGGNLTVETRNITAAESAKLSYKDLPAADYVLIEMVDTGVGVPEAIINKIWEPFFSTKGIGKGSGLGLSAVYGIVKQSEGFIFLERPAGGGAKFRIFFPRHLKSKAD
jgi:signal transduction histidine kinase